MISIDLTNSSDWLLFDKIVLFLSERYQAKVVGRFDGVDERYWDVIIDNKKICLHLQHYLGISLIIESDNEKDYLEEIKFAIIAEFPSL